MRSLSVSFIAALLLCLAALAHARIIKEQWQRTPHGWLMRNRVAPAHRIQLHIFVKQQNTDQLESTLYAVSDPTSPQYGQHLTSEQVDRLVAPSAESVNVVLRWLEEHGVDTRSITRTPNNDILSVVVPAALAEDLLSAEYYHFDYANGASRAVATPHHYSLPEHVAPHIDFVGPTVRLPMIQRVTLSKKKPQQLLGAGNSSRLLGVDPTSLRSLYNIGSYKSQSPSNRVAVTGFLNQFFSVADLNSFFQQYDPQSVGRVANVYGPNDQSNPGIEAALDIEYVMAVGAGVNATFWSTLGSQPHQPDNEPFLVFLQAVASDADPPRVFSISYGDNEDTVDLDYANRVNIEFQKAGVRGISVLASSGDGGVGGSQPSACTNFIPTYPAASPFVTAVGGTTSSGPEVTASLSGGGFSNRWSRPSYQDSAVAHYFSVAQNLPDPSVYNSTGAGFPDVAAQATDFSIVYEGSSTGVDGTSCSSPTFAGLLSLLNDVRLTSGKSTLGWLNPLFYAHPEAFNDIVDGSNPGCGTQGFYAAQGWDPATGLGTPDFQKLVSVVKNLP